MPELMVTIGWRDLTGERCTEQDIANFLQGLNRMSALVSLARVNTLLAVDRFRRESGLTIKVQGFLISNFLDDDTFSRLKRKFGAERLDVRSIFHSQQVLLLARYVLAYGAAEGGVETEQSKEARGVLGRCLLMAGDLLVPPGTAARLRDRTGPKPKRALLLQLSAASGFEVNNPPDLRSSIVRSDALFGDILSRTASGLDLALVFKERTGIEISEYVDFNVGALVNYIARDPNELMEKADPYFLDPDTFFPADVNQSAGNFWKLELATLEQYREELRASTGLAPRHDFTLFRKRPFFLTDRRCMPIHPCFVQEKLEAGLFWAIFHAMKDGAERNALFSLWGRLFETYVIETLGAAARGKDRFVPFPKYRDNKQEAFDGILSNGRVCIVFESKAGFLRAESKFSEDLKLLIPDLQDKFGRSNTGALLQMVSNITQVFNESQAQRRRIESLDLTGTRVVVPVLIVQEKFVSSPLTAYFLASEFRSELRKQRLARDIDCQCQGLIVMDAYDVEALRACNSSPKFDLLDCIFERSRLGDQVYDFHDFLIDYAHRSQVSLRSGPSMDERFRAVFDRITQRFFHRPLSEGAEEVVAPG